jgi:hypothetical protein
MKFTKREGTTGKASKGSVFADHFAFGEEAAEIIGYTPSNRAYKKKFPSEDQASRFIAGVASRNGGRCMLNLDAGWSVVNG